MLKLQNGEYVQMTAEEIAAVENMQQQVQLQLADKALDNLRMQRNSLLAATDWTQLPNSPLSTEKKTEYEVYRQALRDMMVGLENAEDALFPDKPE